MLPNATRRVLMVTAAIAMSACGEPSRPSTQATAPLEPSLARVSDTCRTGDLASLARSYFSPPEQQTMTDTLRSMQDACAGGDDAGVVSGGWAVLSTIEAVLGTETGGAASDGADLANGVITYMCAAEQGLCAPPPASVSARWSPGSARWALLWRRRCSRRGRT